MRIKINIGLLLLLAHVVMGAGVGPIISGGGGITTTNVPASGQVLFTAGPGIFYWDYATNAPSTNVVLTGDVTKSAGSTATTIAAGHVVAAMMANDLDTNVFSATGIAHIFQLLSPMTNSIDNTWLTNRMVKGADTNLFSAAGYRGLYDAATNVSAYQALLSTNGLSANLLTNKLTGQVDTNVFSASGLAHILQLIGNTMTLTNVVVAAGANVTVTPVVVGGVTTYTVASTGGGAGNGTNTVVKGVGISVATNLPNYTVSLAYPTLYVSPAGLTNNPGTPLLPLPMPYALTLVGGGTLIVLTNFPASAYWDLTATNSGLTIQPVGYPNNYWNTFLQVTNSAAASIFIEPGVSNVTVQGVEILNNTNQDGIKFVGAIGITIRDCYLHNNVGNGLLGTGINGALIERNLLVGNGTNNTDVGHFHGSYLQGTNIVYRGNVGYDQTNGYAAQFYPSNNVNLQVYNNLFYKNNRGMVISAEAGLTNYAFNNTIVSNTSTAIQLYGTTTGTVYLTNNIILNNGNGSIASAGGLTVIEDYNVVESAVSSPGTHDVVAASVTYVNGANGLYWLAYGSAARNAAVNQPPPVDFFGYPQTSVADIGAFQYGPDNWKAFDTRTLYHSAFPAYWDVKAMVPEAYQATNTLTAEIVASTNAATLGTQLKSMTNTVTLNAQGLALETELVAATNSATLGTQLKSMTNTATLNAQGLALETELIAATNAATLGTQLKSMTNTATLGSQGLALGTELVASTNTTTLLTQMAGQSPAVNMVNMTNWGQPLLSFASDSNAMVLDGRQSRFTAARAVGVTNIILPDTTHAWYSTMTVTNPLATTITNYFICSGLKPEGGPATNAAAVIGFNGMVVPAGGVVDFTIKYDGYSTNYMGMYK